MSNQNQLNQPTFCIIIPSYNNRENYKRNLTSIFDQKYRNYRILYFDDCSKDNTYNLVKKYINTKLSEQERQKIALFKNPYNCKQGLAKYVGAHMATDNEVLVFLDGDDWFYSPETLTILSRYYANNPDIWMTYGSTIEYNEGKYRKLNISRPLQQQTIENNDYRTGRQGFVTSHLRTCYAWLYKLIALEYLLAPDYKFLPFSTDVAEMRCLVELASTHHQFISKRIHVYNRENSLQYNSTYIKRKNNKESLIVRQHIKDMPRLNPLQSPIYHGYSFTIPVIFDNHICLLTDNTQIPYLNISMQRPIPTSAEEIDQLSPSLFYLLLSPDISPTVLNDITKDKIEMMIRMVLNTRIDVFMLDWVNTNTKTYTHLYENVVFFPIRKTPFNNWSGLYSKQSLLKTIQPDITKTFGQRLALGFV